MDKINVLKMIRICFEQRKRKEMHLGHIQSMDTKDRRYDGRWFARQDLYGLERRMIEANHLEPTEAPEGSSSELVEGWWKRTVEMDHIEFICQGAVSSFC